MNLDDKLREILEFVYGLGLQAHKILPDDYPRLVAQIKQAFDDEGYLPVNSPSLKKLEEAMQSKKASGL